MRKQNAAATTVGRGSLKYEEGFFSELIRHFQVGQVIAAAERSKIGECTGTDTASPASCFGCGRRVPDSSCGCATLNVI